MPFFVVVDPSDELPLMQQEIFGPILPIKTYRTTQDVIDRVNAGDRPLGLYVFSDDRAFIDEITQHTQSGGVAVNVIAMQGGQPSMGFGGVGASGMGRRHGEEGFREFSNPRGYFERRTGGTFDLIFPPYGEATQRLVSVAYGPLVKQLLFAATTLPKNLIARFRRAMGTQPNACPPDLGRPERPTPARGGPRSDNPSNPPDERTLAGGQYPRVSCGVPTHDAPTGHPPGSHGERIRDGPHRRFPLPHTHNHGCEDGPAPHPAADVRAGRPRLRGPRHELRPGEAPGVDGQPAPPS
jgi:hypothetical protein